MQKLSKLAALLIASALVSAPAFAAEKAKAVAVVNGTAIPASLVDGIINEQKQHGGQDTKEVRDNLKEQLIITEVLVQEAKKKGLDKDPDVLLQLDLNKRSVLSNAVVREYAKSVKFSDEQIKKEYDKIVAASSSLEYKARHILVETEDQAKDIIAKLKKGEKFEDLAKQSKDPGSKDNGGDMGWSSPGIFVKPFAEALTKLKKGQTTDTPVKTEFGYHVIQLEDTRPATLPSLDQIKPQLTQRLQQQAMDEYVKGLRAKAKVE